MTAAADSLSESLEPNAALPAVTASLAAAFAAAVAAGLVLAALLAVMMLAVIFALVDDKDVADEYSEEFLISILVEDGGRSGLMAAAVVDSLAGETAWLLFIEHKRT